MQAYHYTECGLDNVFIEGMETGNDHASEPTITIPAIGLLHKVIAESIVNLPFKMTGKELRFLRTEMGLTQERLARILKVTNITVSRWEREETAIKDTAEMLVRLMAVHELELDESMNVNEMSEKVTSSPQNTPIRIDGSDPLRYQPLAA
ncbi:MAG: helix-turn-helix transcriptional regulator [Albidovulum sp.]|nr:helix-turn-helix transcriptional regulator [Albidovulum sp.]